MSSGDDDEETQGRKSLRVASRAYRRGRKLRSSWLTPTPSRAIESREALAHEDDVWPSAERVSDGGGSAGARGPLPAAIPSDAPTSPGMPGARPLSGEFGLGSDGSAPPTSPARGPHGNDRASDAPSIRVRESDLPSDFDSDQDRVRRSRLSRPPVPEFGLESLKRERATWPTPAPAPASVAPALLAHAPVAPAPHARVAPVERDGAPGEMAPVERDTTVETPNPFNEARERPIVDVAGVAVGGYPTAFDPDHDEQFDDAPSAGDLWDRFEDDDLDEGESPHEFDGVDDGTPTRDLRMLEASEPVSSRGDEGSFPDSEPVETEGDDEDEPWDRDEFDGVEPDLATGASLGPYEFFDEPSAPLESAGIEEADLEALEVAGQPKRGSFARPLGIGLGFVVLGAAVWFARSAATEDAPNADASAAPVAASQSALVPGPTSSVAPSAAPSSVAPSVPTAAPAPSAQPVTDTEFEAMRMEFVRLHSSRKLVAAEEVARKMIAARADDALGYRCLGAALQDRGRGTEAKEAYRDCVEQAQRGDVGECVKLGGAARRRAQ